jgi:DnaJ-class molecular chaperone
MLSDLWLAARLSCRARAQEAREQLRQQYQKHQQEHEQRQREQQAREERQQQKQQHKGQRDQQQSTGGNSNDKFDGMMGFGSQTLPPDACPAVRSVLQAADYYAVLGLSSSDYSTEDEFDQQLRSARRRAALAVHPDKVGSSGHNAASRVNLAYDTLSDDVSRGQYDAYLRRCRRGS